MPSAVAGPRWRAQQMRIGTALAAEPIPGSTRPGHRLGLTGAWRVAWPAALWAGLAFSLTVDDWFLGVAVLGAGWLALGGILWSRVAPGLPRALALLALGGVTGAVAVGLALLWYPSLPTLVSEWRTIVPPMRSVDELLPALAAPVSRLTAATRAVFFEAPQISAEIEATVAATYQATPLTASWPQPWAGIVGLSLFGLGLATVLRRAQVSGVGALVGLAWLAGILGALALTAPLDAQRVFLPLLPPAALFAAYGLTALVAARGDLRALGR